MPAKKVPANKTAEKSSGPPSAAPAASPSFRNFALLLTVLLICCAVLAAVVFILQYLATQEVLKAMKDIRSFMVKKGGTERLTDPQILLQATELAGGLSRWTEQKNLVNSKVEEIIRLKKDNWIGYEGHLYYLSPEKTDGVTARMDCRNLKAILCLITSSTQEKYLENLIKKKGLPHWIGVRLNVNTGKWMLEDGHEQETSLQFWNTDKNMPIKFNGKTRVQGDSNGCVQMAAMCESGKCWENVLCRTLNNFICRRDPDKQFYP